MGLTGLKLSCHQGCDPSGGYRKDCFSVFLSCGFLGSWPLAPVSKPALESSVLLTCTQLWQPLLPSCTFKTCHRSATIIALFSDQLISNLNSTLISYLHYLQPMSKDKQTTRKEITKVYHAWVRTRETVY